MIYEGLALAGLRANPNLAPSCCDKRHLYCLEISIVSAISTHPIQVCSTSTLCCAVLGGRWIDRIAAPEVQVLCKTDLRLTTTVVYHH